ncbi:MAG: hypothetical protein IJ145_09815, partial [Prevotella sp.]|nr:hypothetical protein [Prevotella sp.]
LLIKESMVRFFLPLPAKYTLIYAHAGSFSYYYKVSVLCNLFKYRLRFSRLGESECKGIAFYTNRQMF